MNKNFSWSWSRLSKWRTCPRKYYHYDIVKDIPEEPSIALKEGYKVHKAFQNRVELGLPMPEEYKDLSDWGDELLKQYHPKQKIYCEYDIALTRELKQCGTKDWNLAWLRVKIDHLKLIPRNNSSLGALVIDFKTGKFKNELAQLAIYARAIFSVWPQINVVRTEYWWTAIKDKSVEIFTRKDAMQLWNTLLPELKEMEKAHKENNFPPRPSGLCKRNCEVTNCEFYRKGVSRYDKEAAIT